MQVCQDQQPSKPPQQVDFYNIPSAATLAPAGAEVSSTTVSAEQMKALLDLVLLERALERLELAKLQVQV